MSRLHNDTQIPMIGTEQNLSDNLPYYLQHIENVLTHYLQEDPTNQGNTHLYEAIRYAVLGGGKRVRPLLIYASGSLLSVDLTYLDAAAAAIEFIHVYSLIHDDLPAMDDDDLRRNKPTLHKAYDEATAILAGDALQTLAFQVLANTSHHQETHSMHQRLQAISLLAHAAGAEGMVGGQMLDMAGEHTVFNQTQIETMFRLKTGMLLRAAILLPVYGNQIVAPEHIQALDEFAKAIGLAFQIQDDILDVESDTITLGKPQGSDQERGKSSYPSVLGMTYAKARAKELYEQAKAHLDIFGTKADSLRFMADYIIQRRY